MPETYYEYMCKVYIRVKGKERLNELCSILRGLLHANNQSGGRATTNEQFRNGVTIEFGTGPSARDFMSVVRFFIKKSVRERLTLELRG